jgi:hypothetical protein
MKARRRSGDVSPVESPERMTTRKDDVPSLQLEVLKKIQAELARLNEKSDQMNERLDATNERLDSLAADTREGFLRVRTELVALREEMDVGFTALRVQNDRRFLDHERRLRELEQRR